MSLSGNVHCIKLFKYFYTNADCLYNKLDELKSRIGLLSFIPHVIAIVEVKAKHLLATYKESEFCLPGYVLYHSNLENNHHRGVILYVHDSLYATLHELPICFEEYVFVSLKTATNEHVNVCLVYRSPNSDDKNNSLLLNLMTYLSNLKNNPLIIMGDFNTSGIDWDIPAVSTGINSFGGKLLENIRENALTQYVTQATRFRGDNTPHLLDLFLTNNLINCTALDVIDPLGRSDHCVILAQIPIHCKVSKPTPKFCYDKGNYVELCNFLRINWDDAL